MREVDKLPTSCAVVTKSENLNFLEPSGSLQTCNGTDLPFAFKPKLMPRLRVRIPPGHGCLSVVSVVCCQVEVSATI